ncbi:GlcG/HbpS family heme-binding protein [Variovorax sp. LT1R16]|uniref:GlcG/HbpS family heme-binding protein n=1 Tax=Variovorax sp. LT1R16 TaxID=3443728 RepID=UPI003F450B84
MQSRSTFGFTALVLVAVATGTQAQPPTAVRAEKNMSLALANQMAAGAVAACAAQGHAITATVVDRAGGVRAVQRADMAGPHTLGSSERKAWTAASAKTSTLALMALSQKDPTAANLANLPGFLLLGGGVPVTSGTELIGAIGVGGAPGAHLDEQCAIAGIESVRRLLD